MARKILENAGYTVLVASNGDEALTCFRRAVAPVHLLLTDVVMPGMSGPTLVGRLREEGGRTSILYTSGYADDALTGDGSRDERIQFLPKPYTGTTLLRKVREVLDAKPAPRAAHRAERAAASLRGPRGDADGLAGPDAARRRPRGSSRDRVVRHRRHAAGANGFSRRRV